MDPLDADAKIYVDASCDILYSSYYIYGLQELFGKNKVKFTSKFFKDFRHDNHFFAFVWVDKETIKKFIIDFTDSSNIDEAALNWCDVYGKINLEENFDISEKILAIGPSFGIQIYGPFETIYYACSNYLKSLKRIPNKRRFFSDYKSQLNRPKYSEYRPEQSKSNYIFFLSSLWKKETKTNRYRANFIQACKNSSTINFEGGFAPRSKNDIVGFEEHTIPNRLSIGVYLEKSKQSSLVFNTPVVKGCHGWKLAEFLALGKAIITTPLSRVMPSPLTDCNTFLITDGSSKDISKKLTIIETDTILKRTLEKNSHKYFIDHLAPNVIIAKLLGNWPNP